MQAGLGCLAVMFLSKGSLGFLNFLVSNDMISLFITESIMRKEHEAKGTATVVRRLRLRFFIFYFYFLFLDPLRQSLGLIGLDPNFNPYQADNR